MAHKGGGQWVTRDVAMSFDELESMCVAGCPYRATVESAVSRVAACEQYVGAVTRVGDSSQSGLGRHPNSQR